jgi:hypothetical protein
MLLLAPLGKQAQIGSERKEQPNEQFRKHGKK